LSRLGKVLTLALFNSLDKIKFVRNQRLSLTFSLLAVFFLAACQVAEDDSWPAISPTHSEGTYTPPAETFTPSPTILELPPASSTPLPSSETVCNEKGRMITAVLNSPALRQPMDYRVFLPPCYESQPQKRYPVLYLIHGQSYTDDQWDRLGADDIAEGLILEGEVPPFLLVMPRDRVWEQPKDDPFGQVVVEELLPLVDEQYRTLPERQYRAIGGLSRGAGWALHLGLTHWQLFGAFGCHSLAVFESDAPHIAAWLDEIPRDAIPRIFLDIGDHDRPPILQSAIWFEQLLTQKRIPHEWYLFSGYHEEAYWQAHLPQYLRWYTQPWQE
jgi:enterochelin esterase-like enzyme